MRLFDPILSRNPSATFLLILLMLGPAGCAPAKKTAQSTNNPLNKKVLLPSNPSDSLLKKASMARTDSFLEDLLRQYPAYFDSILQNREALHVQIIYTRIDRKANNDPVFTDFCFNVDSQSYFYPASTVKMPTALLALQRLRELKLDKDMTMITESAYSGQTPVYNDPTTPDGRPTVAQYVRKIFLVSDNDAFNRLYEFLGPDYINGQLHRMGYPDAQIRHRLEVSLTEDENRHTNPVRFYDAAGEPVYQQPMQAGEVSFAPRSDFLGKGYMKNGVEVPGPFDFSKKNRLSLEDLHHILQSVLFPASVPAGRRFGLSPEDYRFVWKYMSEYPPESTSPAYDTAGYWDAYGKLLLWGSERKPLPKRLRIFNKEGDAYGFLTDVAYIVDFDKKVEFMLAATIYCNSDGILNDNHYDYDSLGLPFMKHLGQVLYDYECRRARPQEPDLRAFERSYDE